MSIRWKNWAEAGLHYKLHVFRLSPVLEVLEVIQKFAFIKIPLSIELGQIHRVREALYELNHQRVGQVEVEEKRTSSSAWNLTRFACRSGGRGGASDPSGCAGGGSIGGTACMVWYAYASAAGPSTCLPVVTFSRYLPASLLCLDSEISAVPSVYLSLYSVSHSPELHTKVSSINHSRTLPTNVYLSKNVRPVAIRGATPTTHQSLYPRLPTRHPAFDLLPPRSMEAIPAIRTDQQGPGQYRRERKAAHPIRLLGRRRDSARELGCLGQEAPWRR